MEKSKRTRRTKEEMDAIRNNNIATLELVGDVKKENEGDSEDSEEKDAGRAYFFIDNGKEKLRVKALKDCWAIQKFVVSLNSKTGLEEESWASFKYVTDLGSVANRIYEMRLKNSEATTLKELSALSKQIGVDIREEFRLKKERVK